MRKGSSFHEYAVKRRQLVRWKYGNLRDDLVVICDEDGLAHGSVLCHPANGVDTEPFLVAMCDFFVSLDTAVAKGTMNVHKPARRWALDHEKPGAITCLSCIGG